MSALKALLRGAGARALYWSGAVHPRRAVPGGELRILTFHRVLPEAERAAYPYPDLAVTPEWFDSLLAYCARWFRCLPMDAAVRASREPGGVDDRPLLAITFDDGQWDNWKYALPLLQRHGVPATFYVTVGAVETGELLWHDRLGFAWQLASPAHRAELARSEGLPAAAMAGPLQLAEAAKDLDLAGRERWIRTLGGGGETPSWARMMDWNQVRELAAAGQEVGCHSMSHEILLERHAPDLAVEVDRAKEQLEAELGQAVGSYAYPNGDHDRASRAAVAAAGFGSAVSTAWGANDADSDPFALARFDVVQRRNQDRHGRIDPAVFCWRMSRYCRGA